MLHPQYGLLEVGKSGYQIQEFIHPFFPSLLVPGLAAGCLENGVGINAWTVDDPAMLELCLQSGANIITNVPDIAVQKRREFEAK